MNTVSIRLPLLALALSSTVFACAAATSEDASDPGTDVTSSEVRTRDCPASFALTLTDIEATPVPSWASVGGAAFPLSTSHRSRLETIQSELVAAGTVHVAGEILTRQNGVCTYRDPASAVPVPTMKLYSKNGKDILELNLDLDRDGFAERHRVYAFPTSIDASGMTFGAGEALLDGVIRIPDGPNLVVKVGVATIAL
jgi:hypothetical protein